MHEFTPRQLWELTEPLHALVYFDDESKQAWVDAGIRGFWRGYFSTRAAPLGITGPGVVTAAFFNFAPSMVARAIPSVWDLVSPAEALAARLDGADRALRRTLGGTANGAAVVEAAALARTATESCDAAGRPLFAANADLPWPTIPHLVLWHALTLLREHRGDGHNAALVAAGIDGCGAHILAGATGGAPRPVIQPARGWSDDEWDAAEQRLRARGIIDDLGIATPVGRTIHRDIEAATDHAASRPWDCLGPIATQQLVELVAPLSSRITGSATIRFPNPMNLPQPGT